MDTHAGSGINGGIGTSSRGPAYVTFYVEGDDIQALLDRAEELGGKTVVPVTAMDMVTFAQFADPDGLVVGLVKSEPDQEDQGASAGDNPPVDWFEILGTDAERTQRFYADLFGWHMESGDFPGYALVDTHAGRGVNGGAGVAEAGTWVTVYARVPDVEAALARALTLGGKRVYGPDDVQQGLRTAAFQDPAGGVFGLYSQA